MPMRNGDTIASKGSMGCGPFPYMTKIKNSVGSH